MFIQRLKQLLYGRYGTDQYYFFLFGAFCVLMLVCLFVPSYTTRSVINLVALALAVYMGFRTFSKNIYKRRAENEKFLKIWRKITGFFKLTGCRIRDIGTYRYRGCPDCQAVLCLPRRTGTHTAVCPKCGKRFDVKVLF